MIDTTVIFCRISTRHFLIGVLFLSIIIQTNAQTSVITLTERKEQQQLNMPWRNTIAVGRAYNLLRADALSHLAYAQSIMGYRYCRFHAIFDDDMNVVVRRKDGTIAYQWFQVDRVYDALLKMGIRPFVELNPMPKVLASGDQTMFGYKMNVTPPKSYEEWSALIEAFAHHVIERYGAEEVHQWYFEVWNEPNLKGFWSGTQEDYFKLYAASAFALKKVDNRLRVGGPASATGAWIEDIINYTSKNKVPLDFISTHLYPQDEQVEYPDRKGSPYNIGDYFSHRVKQIASMVKASARPDMEIHLTEWNSLSAKDKKNISWTSNSSVDNLYAASFIVRNCIELDNTVQSMAYWVVSDIFDEVAISQNPFGNIYGLLTIQGIPKASFNAFALLRQTNGYLLNVLPQKKLPSGAGLTAVNENGTLRILLWNQHFLESNEQQEWTGTLSLPLKADSTQYSVIRTKVGVGAGSPWESWQLMGRPQNLTHTQLELLKAHAIPAYILASLKTNGTTKIIDFKLLPGEVQLIEITPLGQTVTQKTTVNSADLERWEKAMNDKTN
jgi:xylan 1,4-beta-xylosidase